MCRFHIKTVREIRREEYSPQENVTPDLDFGGFVQSVFSDFPQPWTPNPTNVLLPLPPVFFNTIMQLTAGLQPPATVDVNLVPPNGATQEPQIQTSTASHQSQGGSNEPSEQPQTTMDEFSHQTQEMTGLPHMPQEDAGQSQQPQADMSELFLPPQVDLDESLLPLVGFNELFQHPPEGTSGSSQQSQGTSGSSQQYQGTSGSSQQSQGTSGSSQQYQGTSGFSQQSHTVVSPGPLLQASVMESYGLSPVNDGFFQQPQTGTNELSQQSQGGLQGILPGSGNMPEFFQLQAGPSGLLQQPEGNGHGPSQQTHIGMGGSSQQPFTSASGLSVPQTSAVGPLQQLEVSAGGILPLPGWDSFQHTHSGLGGIPHHTQGNNQELPLQHQPGTNGPPQPFHYSIYSMDGTLINPGNMVGFSQQQVLGPSGFSLQPHQITSVLSLLPHIGSPVLLPFVLAIHHLQMDVNGLSEPSEASNHGSSQQSQAGVITSSQPSEAHVNGQSHVPSSSTGLLFPPPFMDNGGILQGHIGMSGSFQQPGNTDALLQQSQVTTSETTQHPEENTNENAQDLPTDTDELSQADMRDL